MQGHEIPTDGSVRNPDLSSARSSVGASAGTVLFVTVLDRSLVDRGAFPERRAREGGRAGNHVGGHCGGNITNAPMLKPASRLTRPDVE